jgi:hypothetical protein
MWTPPRSDDHFGVNILALDGGGIYGLTEALLLKKLCRACEWFLSGDDQPIFAGCSAGALNALLLAQEKRPRDAVLSGKLEAFWKESGTFSNSNPTNAYLSLFGLTPWFSDTDFLHLLEQYFGDSRLSQLAHPVIITGYSWNGRTPKFDKNRAPLPWPMSVFASMAEAQAQKPSEDSWGPVCFTSIQLPDDVLGVAKIIHNKLPVDDYNLVDVAYAAASPPGYRRVRGGVGDGGAFNANPAVTALAIAQRLRVPLKGLDLFQARLFVISRDHGGMPNDALRLEHQFKHVSAGEKRFDLANITVLSVGAGQAQPAYWLTDVDLGMTAFQAVPTNPNTHTWMSPSSFSLDPEADDAALIGKHLLGENFHRLNPGVMTLPTMAAVTGCRFPWIRQQYILQIESGVESDEVRKDVTATTEFLTREWELPKGLDAYVQELARGANLQAVKQSQLAFWGLIEAARTTDPALTSAIVNLVTQGPPGIALEAAMWDKMVTTGKPFLGMILAEGGTTMRADVTHILREIRGLVDRAVELSFLGDRLASLEGLTKPLQPSLLLALAEKFGLAASELEACLPAVPDLVRTFYATDAATAARYLRLAADKSHPMAMVELCGNLQRRLGVAPAKPDAPPVLFEAPALPDVMKDPIFLDTVTEVLRKALNTSTTASA